jgi:carboxyl-terminal processing protease
LGGSLQAVISTCDLLLDNGTIVTQRDANGRETSYVAKAGAMVPDIPIVLLQNQYSASASEILSAALKENGRATVVGQTSFGKGTVNTPRELTDGGALFVTIAEWLTPSGALIDKVGIRPDIEVIPSDDDIDARRDVQLFKAIDVLRGQVKAP